jgi:hypothetical protein
MFVKSFGVGFFGSLRWWRSIAAPQAPAKQKIFAYRKINNLTIYLVASEIYTTRYSRLRREKSALKISLLYVLNRAEKTCGFVASQKSASVSGA